MSLTKILEQIKTDQVNAATPVTNEPRETYTGRLGRQQRAVENLKDLKVQYRKELRDSAVYIVVVGSAKDDFTNTATESFGLFSANPTELYNDLANRLSPGLYQSNASTHDLFQVFGRHLEDKAIELGLEEINQMVFRQEYRRNITSKEGVVQLITEAINQQIGPELVGIQAVHSITDKAIESNHLSKTTPILLSTESEQLALDLVSSLYRLNVDRATGFQRHAKNTFLVIAGKSTKALRNVPGSISVKEVTKESVEQTLTTIKTSIKK